MFVKRTRVTMPVSYDALGAYVDSKNGVATVPARRLRDMHGAQRLGSEIRESIMAELRRRGLGHQPTSIPDDHRELVRVYRVGSPVGELISAACEVDRDNDQILRTAVHSPEVLERVRTLVNATT